jgi:uncharacterized protein (TIGR02246 family)
MDYFRTFPEAHAMRHTLITAAALIATVLAGAAIVSASPDPSRADDENAIRQTGKAFIKASNAHDAKALAALFSPAGEIVNDEGHVIQGRAAIEQTYAAMFQAYPNLKISGSTQSLRFVCPAVAIEDGTSVIKHKSGEGTEHDRYSVVYVKEDGRWQVASARDLPGEDSAGGDELDQLGWLIGQWVDESPDAMVATSYRWDENRRAILSEFKIQIGGRPAMTGSVRIAWDPSTKKLHSWVFDSEGGFAQGVWTRDGNRWVVKLTGSRRDGNLASATNIITHVAKDRMTWQSRDRVVGDEVRPDVGAIPIVRRPPQPGSPAPAANRQPTGESK